MDLVLRASGMQDVREFLLEFYWLWLIALCFKLVDAGYRQPVSR